MTKKRFTRRVRQNFINHLQGRGIRVEIWSVGDNMFTYGQVPHVFAEQETVEKEFSEFIQSVGLEDNKNAFISHHRDIIDDQEVTIIEDWHFLRAGRKIDSLNCTKEVAK